MARPVRPLKADPEQIEQLNRLVSASTSAQRMVVRARIILLRHSGLRQADVATGIGVTRKVVGLWERRFSSKGLSGLEESARSGRKPWLADEIREQIITEATRPPPTQSRWSTRKMAKAKKVSASTVRRLWKANDIQPHLTRTFKISTDKHFEPKFWDVIGLYLNPPERALVLCCDEKSQCQALERTQPGLPLGMGYTKTHTHDYVRHGTVTLFAALSYLDGKLYQASSPQHTHKEWLSFLKQLDKEAPGEVTLHLIVDNYATHKHEAVNSWIKWRNQRHRKQHGIDRMVVHFTPTSSSWMNMVERFFRDLTVECVREGSFTSTKELVDAMEAYIAERNLEPKVYRWKAKGEEILAKIERAKKAQQRQSQ